MPQVQVIQPIQQQPKRLRVAAYARVSSDSEDQLNSLAVQVDYYCSYILYKRTSAMNSSEMSHLIDGARQEAHELGIDI